MKLVQQIIVLADAYSKRTGAPDSTISHRVFADTSKLTALRNGADLTTSRYERTVAWFSDNWPEGLAWPEGLDRPEPQARTEIAGAAE